METVGVIVGWFVLVAVGCVAVLIAFHFACVGVEALHRQIIRSHDEKVARRIGRQMASESYWFSGHPEVQSALRIIGEQLAEEANFSIERARSAWRQETGRQ